MPKQPEKKKDRTNDPSLKRFVVCSIIIILLFPLIINLIMFIPASLTSSDLDAKTWLSFWGSYGGGIIGGVGALLAVLLTIRYYMAKDAEQKLLLKLTPLIERISFLQQQVYSREIIKDETLLGLDVNEEIKAKIKEYNKLVPFLKGIFAEQAIGTLIGVFQLKNEEGEMFLAIQP